MDALKLYLDKFKNLRPADDELKELLQQIIKDLTGASLAKKDITIQKWTVFIKAPAALKSELYINQEKILGRLLTELKHPGLKRII